MIIRTYVEKIKHIITWFVNVYGQYDDLLFFCEGVWTPCLLETLFWTPCYENPGYDPALKQECVKTCLFYSLSYFQVLWHKYQASRLPGLPVVDSASKVTYQFYKFPDLFLVHVLITLINSFSMRHTQFYHLIGLITDIWHMYDSLKVSLGNFIIVIYSFVLFDHHY